VSKKVYLLIAGHDGVVSVYESAAAAEEGKRRYIEGKLVEESRRWWERFGPGRFASWEEFLATQIKSIEESWYVSKEEVLS
jgi:hypothetical protein